jgi:hypothetical protein
VKTSLPIVWVIGYGLLGVVQVLAILDGIEAALGVHWLLAGLLGLFLAYMPVIGTLLGIWGAVAAWGWRLPAALALFLGPHVVYGGLVLLLILAARVQQWTLIRR